MNFSFMWSWVEWIWEEVRSFNYSFILDGSNALFDFLFSAINFWFTSDQSITQQIADSEFFYNKEPIRKFNVYIITWNVKSKPPPAEERLSNLLRMEEDYARPEETVPDIYAIGLQEVTGGEAWCKVFLSQLGKRNYVLIEKKQMMNLMLFCFVKRKHLLNLRNIDTDETRVGLLGIKGTISIRLSLSGCSMCLANSHFSRDKVEERINDYHQTTSEHRYHVVPYQNILSHDLIFWFGDFNFRLNWNNKLTPEETEELIQINERDKLLKMDELLHLMRDGTVFKEFVEKPINFPPTYKFEHATPFYNLARKPAWTDRILYKLKENPYENAEFKVEQGLYSSHAECDISDHRPVTTEYNVEFVDISSKPSSKERKMNKEANNSEAITTNQIFMDPSRYIVEFDHIDKWAVDATNIIEYTLPAGFRERPGSDWIALFKHDFNDLAMYIAYEYVPNYTSSGSNIYSNDIVPTYVDVNEPKKRRIALDFSENGINIFEGAKYVLLYFERENNGVLGVAGISNPFIAKKSNVPVEIK